MSDALRSAFADDPEVIRALENRERNNLLRKSHDNPPPTLPAELLAKIQVMKGDTGEAGKTPKKGEDFWTPEDIDQLSQTIKPKKGEDYFTPEEIKSFLQLTKGKDGRDGRNGRDGFIPIKGQHYNDGKDGKPGKSIIGPRGPRGKDVTDIEPQKLVDVLNGQKGKLNFEIIKDFPTVETIVSEIKKKKMIEMKDVKNMPLNMNDMRWHGGGLTKVSHDDTLSGDGTVANPLVVVTSAVSVWQKETPVGLINGANKIYTLSHISLANSMNLVVNGQIYTEGVDYSISGTTLTMVVALPSQFSTLPFIAQYQS